MNYGHNDELIRAAAFVLREQGSAASREKLAEQLYALGRTDHRISELHRAVLKAPSGADALSADYDGQLRVEIVDDSGNHLPEYRREHVIPYCGNQQKAAERLVKRFARDCPPNCTVTASTLSVLGSESVMLARASGVQGCEREPKAEDLRSIAERIAAGAWHSGD